MGKKQLYYMQAYYDLKCEKPSTGGKQQIDV